MLVARVFCFYLSIFWFLVWVAECGNGPPNGVPINACSSNNGKYNGLKHAFASYFGSNYAFGHQNGVPNTQQEDVFCSSELSYLSSLLFGRHSEAQCLIDVNRSGPCCSSNSHNFQLPGGGTITCSLNYRELGNGISCASANDVDHIVQKKISFVSKNSDIGKSQFSSDYSSPCVRISPYKLDWGQRYLYHPSVAHVSLQNTCNESVLKVYESFSTNSQFYPFNISEIVLGPGEVTTIPFIFSPKWLGLSLAELILQTSFGGFLVKAQGLAVESPHKLRPLQGLGVSSGGWLSKKLPLLNPFDESIHLKEVTAWFAVFESSSSILLSESYCIKHDHHEINKHTFSDPRTLPSIRSMEIRLLSNWIIDPHKTESILELAFPPGFEGHVLGSICVRLVRPREGEKDTLMIPFEAELNRTTTRKNNGLLSHNVESIGGCDGNETTLSVSVRNNALHLVKVIKVGEVSYTKKPIQIKIKYTEGLLLLPGTVTHVALVTYECCQVMYNMDDLNMRCMVQILTNETVDPILEISCWEMFLVCSRQLQKMLHHRLDDVDLSNKRRESSTMSRNLPFSIMAFGDTEVDEFVLQSWQSQSTKGGLYVLNEHELSFPTVPLGSYYAKSITVRNPSQEPIIVQLILNSREIVDDCKKTNYDNLLSPSPNNYILDNSPKPNKYGFSLIDSAVIEAYLQPYGSAMLGPIFFQPSNRCDWKSAALIRNNVSGVELLSLIGRGGSFSLALYEGLEYVHQLNFNTNFLFPPNMFPHDISPINRDATFGCRISLLKKLVAVNSGDFTVTVHGIHVSGTKCGLDGFTVHNCKAFALDPGESIELGISYHPDFSASLVSRDLELMLASEVLVIPMKASIPLYILNICRKSIFWVRVENCCLGGLVCILMSLLLWISSSCLDYLIKDERSCKDVERAKVKPSSLNFSKGNNKPFSSTKKASPKSAQKDEPPVIPILTYTKCENVVQCETEKALSSDAPVERADTLEAVQPVSLTVRTGKDKKRKPRKRRGVGSSVSSSQSGNSTPSSPLSPFTTTTSPDGKRCSPSLQNRQPHDPPGLFGVTREGEEEADSRLKVTDIDSKSLGCASSVTGNCGENLLSTQIEVIGSSSKRGNKPMLLPSATFPGMRTRSSPSRFTMPQDARAPGPKIQKAVELEERSSDESLTYDIWADHFSGLHLITRPNKPNVITSEDVEGNPHSFFLRGPKQTLVANSRLKSVCTSSYEQG